VTGVHTITMVGGPHDGCRYPYIQPAPRVIVFQGDFGDGVFRVFDYVRVSPETYRCLVADDEHGTAGVGGPLADGQPVLEPPIESVDLPTS
jgi:hypothetical protein